MMRAERRAETRRLAPLPRTPRCRRSRPRDRHSGAPYGPSRGLAHGIAGRERLLECEPTRRRVAFGVGGEREHKDIRAAISPAGDCVVRRTTTNPGPLPRDGALL